jgi:hypothetical protein
MKTVLPNIVKSKKNFIKELLKTDKKTKNRAIDLINIFNSSNSKDGDDDWYIFFNDSGDFDDINAGELAYDLLEQGCVSSEELMIILDRLGAFDELEDRITEMLVEQEDVEEILYPSY